jgi:hypothetical protein
MSRQWTGFVAAIGDVLPLGLVVLLLFLLAGLIGAGLYWWPAWLPWRWWPSRKRGAAKKLRRRLRWPRFRWRWRRRGRKEKEAEPELAVVDSDQLPDLPTEAFVSLADRLAAEGRYAEAVRERLRGIVRELVEVGVVAHHPGWTVTELAGAAGVARPPVRGPLDGASRVFSDIWYGQRPAGRAHDEQMRQYAAQVHTLITPVPAGELR